eukprot:GHVU01096674.1.p1 GENE.GHVU01096674.1~~GHVU01096674.1.p1  ORF type:complete len:167 (+),score=27.91 GHVU01096674.1:407-907(+)
MRCGPSCKPKGLHAQPEEVVRDKQCKADEGKPEEANLKEKSATTVLQGPARQAEPEAVSNEDSKPAKNSTGAGSGSRVAAKKTPKLELVGDRSWIVEGYVDHPEPVDLSGVEMKHNVFITDCESSTIVIKEKANNITIGGAAKWLDSHKEVETWPADGRRKLCLLH